MPKTLVSSLMLLLALATPAGAWPTGEEMEAVAKESAAFEAATAAERPALRAACLLKPDQRAALTAYLAGPSGDLVPPGGRAALAEGISDPNPARRAAAAEVLADLAKAAGPNLGHRERTAWARLTRSLLAPRETSLTTLQAGLRALAALADPVALQATHALALEAHRGRSDLIGEEVLPPMARWAGCGMICDDNCAATEKLALSAVQAMLLGPGAPPMPPDAADSEPPLVAPGDLVAQLKVVDELHTATGAEARRQRPIIRRIVAALRSSDSNNAFRLEALFFLRRWLSTDAYHPEWDHDPALAKELVGPLGQFGRDVAAALDAGRRTPPGGSYLWPADANPWDALAELQALELALDDLHYALHPHGKTALEVYLPGTWKHALASEGEAFQRATGQPVELHESTTAAALEAVRKRKPVDVVISGDAKQLAAGQRAGLLAGDAVPLLVDRLVLEAQADGLQRTTADLTFEAPGTSIMLAPPDTTEGRLGREMLARLPGGSRLLASKPTRYEYGSVFCWPAGTPVRSQHVPFFFFFASEHDFYPGEHALALPLPPDLPARVLYQAVMVRHPRSPANARAFLARLGSREGLERLLTWGFEVP